MVFATLMAYLSSMGWHAPGGLTPLDAAGVARMQEFSQPAYRAADSEEGSTSKNSSSPVLRTAPTKWSGWATWGKKASFGSGLPPSMVRRSVAGRPSKSSVTNAGGIPPLRQRTAQSLWTLPRPGFITPKLHLESTISPASVNLPSSSEAGSADGLVSTGATESATTSTIV